MWKHSCTTPQMNSLLGTLKYMSSEIFHNAHLQPTYLLLLQGRIQTYQHMCKEGYGLSSSPLHTSENELCNRRTRPTLYFHILHSIWLDFTYTSNEIFDRYTMYMCFYLSMFVRVRQINCCIWTVTTPVYIRTYSGNGSGNYTIPTRRHSSVRHQEVATMIGI